MGDSGEQVRLLSRAMVAPAQPTPSHHHVHFLSCLDIFWQVIHCNRRLIFYESTGVSGHDGRAALMQQLKSSLALCLVHYYPWCGRIAKGALPPHRLFIDCNDAGVEFVEASSDLPLSSLGAQDRFQMKPLFLHLSQFPDHKGDSLYRSPLLSIQKRARRREAKKRGRSARRTRPEVCLQMHPQTPRQRNRACVQIWPLVGCLE